MNESKVDETAKSNKHTVEGITDNNEEEKTQQKCNDKTALDVVFVLDCTGSMNPYIESCKDNILSISSKINDECDNCDVQFALVSYRDIPPQDDTFITKIFNFTPIPFRLKIELENLSANGGGDAPEALTSGLYDCYKNLNWRKKSIKIIIVITDAPPHGLEKNVEDGFPNGDIDTFNELVNEGKDDSAANKYLNVIEIVQSIRNDLKAAIYSVACEPDLSCNNDFANDFMQYIAQYTKGKFLPLSSATLLPDVIVGSVKQQINLNNLTYKLDEEIQKIKAEHGDDISSNEINKIIMQKWKDEGIKKKDISIGTLYRNKRSKYNVNLLMNEQKIKCLKDFKANCKIFPRLKESDFRHLNVDNKKNEMPSDLYSLTGTIGASAEMNLINSKRELLQGVWDKYIDPDMNDDVDCAEWCLAMQKLNVKLNEIQQRKCFKLMDKDKSGYVDKDDFITYISIKFDNIELKQCQERIWDAIRKQNRHHRSHSYLKKDEIIETQPEKKSVIDALNKKLDPDGRPTLETLSRFGIIPENWLLDMYGLADDVRKRHIRMDSAVTDLKSQLIVPPILADVVARDVLDEIETVDPYLDSNYDLSILEKEMGCSMNKMVSTMQEDLKEEETLFEIKNVEKWSKYEVGNWLDSIGMGMYVRIFVQEEIDGLMLLEDIDENMLMCNLGVKKVHVTKMMTEICNLAKVIGKELKIVNDEIIIDNVLENMGRERSFSLSRSCSAQRVYSREASLDIDDMEDVMSRLNIIKSEYN